jgi:hypothetical protein
VSFGYLLLTSVAAALAILWWLSDDE